MESKKTCRSQRSLLGRILLLLGVTSVLGAPGPSEANIAARRVLETRVQAVRTALEQPATSGSVGNTSKAREIVAQWLNWPNWNNWNNWPNWPNWINWFNR